MTGPRSIEYDRCWDCPRANGGKDFCMEYGKYLKIKESRKGIPKWCKKRKFIYARKKKRNSN